jgi:protein-disulfide isomerase
MRGMKGFWDYGDMLFANQKQLKKNPWTTFAQRLNLNIERFEELMKPDSPAAKKVAEDVDVGIGLRLNATPKVFFEGKNIPENVFGGYLVDALEELIKSNHPERQDLVLNRQ